MNNATLNNLALDPAAFREAVLIDADGQTTAFRPDSFQRCDFQAMDPAWKLAAGRMETDGQQPCRRAWLERPRGHSKTSDLAIMITWVLAFASRPIKGIACAADRDQAGLLRDAIATLVRCNPWLANLIEVQQHTVINLKTGSSLDILSSDVGTSYGQLPDFIVADEVSHWPEGKGEQLWNSLLSSAAKRKNCLLLCIMNAGFTETFAYKVREAIRTDPAWYFSHLEGSIASWITPDRLREQQRLLPPAVYSRLWDNNWTSGSGDALTEASIVAAVRKDLKPMVNREEGFAYFAALDLSISRDHSAFVVVARNTLTGRLRLALCKRWVPAHGQKIDLPSVQEFVVQAYRKFYPRFYCDPYQAELMVQLLQKLGIYCELVPFVGTALSEMASGLIETFSDRNIELFEDKDLMADLRSLRLKATGSGWKLDAVRTSTGGHADAGVALALAILAARRHPFSGLASVPDPNLLHKASHGGGEVAKPPPKTGNEDPNQEDERQQTGFGGRIPWDSNSPYGRRRRAPWLR